MALAAGADVVAWSELLVAEVRAAAWAPVRMHVKLDSGLGRLGTRDAEQALAVARRIMEASPLQLVGAMTHFATADEEDLEFVERQLAVFGEFATRMREVHAAIVVHAANSAATLRVPASHFDLVRCGIAIYGCDPMGEDPRDLEPALELGSYVATVKLTHPGESTGYGQLLSGGDALGSYTPAEGGSPVVFCRTCGSTLGRGQRPDGPVIGVCLGTLDDDPGIRPQYHIFVDSRAPWEELPDDVCCGTPSAYPDSLGHSERYRA